MSGLNSERAMIISRKRLKLRRIKSLALIKSDQLSDVNGEIISGEGKCTKRKRKNGGSTLEKATIKPLPSASSSWLDKLSEDDVIAVGESTGENLRRVTCWSNGSVSMIGRRREMEDAVAVELWFLEKYDFFGVYDGHGGSCVAHACREGLHELLAKQVKEEEEVDHHGEKRVIDWEKVMISSFRRMDEEVNKGGSAVAMMGSTAVVAVVGEEELVVANCGDSRAVLSRDGVAVALSDDHKPDRPDELERIEASGGMVISWYGHRVSGVLATSRAIGDSHLKPFVIPEPEVRVIKKTNKDEFLILASDGLWDVISNDHACQFIRNYLEGQRRRRSQETTHGNIVDARSCAARAATLLAELAISRGSKDNVSVIVIELKRSGCCSPSELN